MKVTNVSVVNVGIGESVKNEEFDKILKNNGIKLWERKKSALRFTLLDSNEAFANAIRRVFNDELEIECLYAHHTDVTTDDKFILPDNILERINLIPLEQNKGKADVVMSLKYENKTSDIVNIYSSDIKINTKKGFQSSEELFNQHIQICSLRPGKYLYINNIVRKKRAGYINNCHTLGTHKYECINVDMSKPSLNTNLTDFKLELCDNANSSAVDMATMVRDNLVDRVTKVKSLISNYEIPDGVDIRTMEAKNSNSDTMAIYVVKNTNIVDIKTGDSEKYTESKSYDDIYEIHINNEYHTVGNIITKYVYLVCPEIELINYKLAHILKHKIIVTIKHHEYKRIIEKALNKFLDDINYWCSEIHKNC